jgi:hypothetical protein
LESKPSRAIVHHWIFDVREFRSGHTENRSREKVSVHISPSGVEFLLLFSRAPFLPVQFTLDPPKSRTTTQEKPTLLLRSWHGAKCDCLEDSARLETTLTKKSNGDGMEIDSGDLQEWNANEPIDRRFESNPKSPVLSCQEPQNDRNCSIDDGITSEAREPITQTSVRVSKSAKSSF